MGGHLAWVAGATAGEAEEVLQRAAGVLLRMGEGRGDRWRWPAGWCNPAAHAGPEPEGRVRGGVLPPLGLSGNPGNGH